MYFRKIVKALGLKMVWVEKQLHGKRVKRKQMWVSFTGS